MTVNILSIVKDPKDIPALPAIFNQLMDCIHDPEKTIKDLEKILQFEPGLAVRVLQLANSSFYNFPDKVETLSHAIEIIGMKQLGDLVVGMLVIENFSGIPEDYVTMESFWSHSIACGLAAKELTRQILPKKEEQMYLVGMLHDIGSLVIYKHVPELAKIALEHCNSWGMKLTDAEQLVLGFDHADLGTTLFEKWGLPEIFSETIRFHHTPNKAKKFQRETAILHVADYVVMSNQLGSSGEFQSPYLNPHVLGKMGLSNDALGEVSEKTIDSFEEIFRIFFNEPVTA